MQVHAGVHEYLLIHGAFKYLSFDARNSSQSILLLPSKTKKLNSENEHEIDLYSLHYWIVNVYKAHHMTPPLHHKISYCELMTDDFI